MAGLSPPVPLRPRRLSVPRWLPVLEPLACVSNPLRRAPPSRGRRRRQAAAPIVMRSSGRGAHGAPASPGPEFRPRAAACARRSLAVAAASRRCALRRAALHAPAPASLAALPGAGRSLRDPDVRARRALRADPRPAVPGGGRGGRALPRLRVAGARVRQLTLRITIDAARWTKSP